MIEREELVKIGWIKKTHGIKGEMIFEFTDDSFDESECSFLIFDMDAIFVPFLLEEYFIKSNSSALIKFKNINTGKKAKPLVSKDVYFPKEYIRDDFEEDSFSWNYFTDYVLIDENFGKIGVISDIDDSTINVLFIVNTGKEELLIPASEEFITHIDESKKELFVVLPEGLLDL